MTFKDFFNPGNTIRAAAKTKKLTATILILLSLAIPCFLILSCKKKAASSEPQSSNGTQVPIIPVKHPPVCNFIVSLGTESTMPLTLYCIDLSDGDSLTYTWKMDGKTVAVSASPTLAVNKEGIYNIRLTIGNKFGKDSMEKAIRVLPYQQTYKDFDGITLSLYAWEGKKITILSRKNNLNRQTMLKWLKALDDTYNYYYQCTGQEPTPGSSTYLNNRLTIADVPTTCGAGCGYLGATGIELQNLYFDKSYNAIDQNDEFDQTAFYEFGRNFWFLSDNLAYKSTDPVTTGYAVFMRFMAMEVIHVNGAPFNSWTFPVFRTNVENLIDTYLANPSLNWSNTLGIGQGISGSGLGATDLFASFCFRLRKNYGDDAFVKKLWKEAAIRPKATTTQDAVDNFFLAACAAANKNLTSVFNSWHWPLSTNATTEASKYPI